MAWDRMAPGAPSHDEMLREAVKALLREVRQILDDEAERAGVMSETGDDLWPES